MTRDEEALVQKLRELSETPWIVEIATVTEVNEDNLSCTVELLADDTEIPNVRLKAGIDTVTDGLVQIPSVNSQVLIARINNDISNRCIVAYSKVDKVVLFNGDNGGIVNWPPAKTELDKVKDLLTVIFNVLTGAPIPEPGSGANSALQAALKVALTGKTLPDFEDLVDDKVKH